MVNGEAAMSRGSKTLFLKFLVIGFGQCGDLGCAGLGLLDHHRPGG